MLLESVLQIWLLLLDQIEYVSHLLQISLLMDKKGLFNFPIFDVQLLDAENYTV